MKFIWVKVAITVVVFIALFAAVFYYVASGTS